MNFEFSEDQNLLREQAQSFLRDKCDSRTVRNILEGEDAYDADLWKAIVEMGWTATTIPEAYGGLGLGHLELCVIAEELGRVLAPTPFSSSVYLATEALIQFGSEAQKEAWLPKLAAGELVGTVAVSEGTRAATQKNLETSAAAGQVTGTKIPVPDGDVADFAIVIARDSDDASSLYLVDLTGSGVTREAVKTLDPTRSHARVQFSDAPGEVLGTAGQGWDQLDKLFDRAAVLFAWEQVGGAEAALHMARDYAMGRYAFGRPIASFQAIKHKLADMYIAHTLARSNCYYGAWALSTDAPELPVAAATARVSATEAFHECSKENIQTHGGMGFTWEFDCHLYYRRSKLLSVNLGALPRWKDKLVSRLEQSN
ncbi:MAG: acyl-CoA dehydrogenase family protein [Pseudomonadales bacterium]|jgi:alkylation response protein AidB-like acyl-CoA dehydrogenase|nr:acyl-CoA dehydrogenase family protein [Pseudomonadales bacterium]